MGKTLALVEKHVDSESDSGVGRDVIDVDMPEYTVGHIE